jgi:hypothetical protein
MSGLTVEQTPEPVCVDCDWGEPAFYHDLCEAFYCDSCYYGDYHCDDCGEKRKDTEFYDDMKQLCLDCRNADPLEEEEEDDE